MIKLTALKNKSTLQKITILSFCFLVISILFQVTFTNKYSIKGSELVSYQKQKDELEKEISLLNLEISEVSSLSYVETKARHLGFSEYQNDLLAIGASQIAAAQSY